VTISFQSFEDDIKYNKALQNVTFIK